MKKKFHISVLLCLLSGFSSFAQTEIPYFTVDKKLCFPGDTIWMRGAILGDNIANTSLAFHLACYDPRGVAVASHQFNISSGMMAGQIRMPDIPGQYYLRGYILNSYQEIVIPITVLSGSTAATVQNVADTFNYSHSSNDGIKTTWTENGHFLVSLPDSLIGNYSVSISNIHCPRPDHLLFNRSIVDSNRYSDTSFLRFSTSYDPKYAGERIIYYTSKDNELSAFKTIDLDSAGVTVFQSSVFYGTMLLHYKLNRAGNKATERFKMSLFNTMPRFILPPMAVLKSDGIDAFSLKEFMSLGSNVIQLKGITIKQDFKHRNRELDKRYISDSSSFFWTERITEDLRGKSLSERFNTIGQYILATLPKDFFYHSLGAITGSCPDGLVTYEDEKQVNREMLFNQPFTKFAYMKAYQDGLGPCPVVCVWTRKGEDLNALPSKLKTIALNGLDSTLNWSTPDRLTYHYNSWITTTDYEIDLPQRQFALYIFGTDKKGRPFEFYKLIGKE
jgi:hypothetical protein